MKLNWPTSIEFGEDEEGTVVMEIYDDQDMCIGSADFWKNGDISISILGQDGRPGITAHYKKATEPTNETR